MNEHIFVDLVDCSVSSQQKVPDQFNDENKDPNILNDGISHTPNVINLLDMEDPELPEGHYNTEELVTSVEKVFSSLLSSWNGEIVIPVCLMCPGELPTAFHTFSNMDICKYFGKGNTRSLDSCYSGMKIYFDVMKYGPMSITNHPCALNAIKEDNQGDAGEGNQSFKTLHQDLVLAARDGGFHLIKKENGRFYCSHGFNYEGVHNENMEDIEFRAQSLHNDRVLNNRPDGQYKERRSWSNRPSSIFNTCKFQFIVHAD